MSKSYFDETHCAIGHPKSTFMQWMLTIDHKRIGILYLIAIAVFFFVGVLLGVLMRLELTKFYHGFGPFQCGITMNRNLNRKLVAYLSIYFFEMVS